MPPPVPGLPSSVLFIADAVQPDGDLSGLVARAAASGLRFIELRRSGPAAAGWGSSRRLAEIEACLSLAAEASVLVNDRVDLALAAGAAGAHLGQDDLPAADARRLLGPHRLLGLSTHGEEQIAAAQDLPLDYVAVGPVFASATKSGHAEPIGIDGLAVCCRLSRLPVVAIGGITVERAPSVLDAGAACLAVGRGLSQGNLAEDARRFLDLVGG